MKITAHAAVFVASVSPIAHVTANAIHVLNRLPILLKLCDTNVVAATGIVISGTSEATTGAEALL